MTVIAPLVPIDVDLRDFAFMPVDIVRLFNSGFHAQATDAEWRAGVTLWLKSYHQVPASSLPDDDVALARLAELGRDVRVWRKVKNGALRGWTKCSDGRLYHRTVAEKVLEGWIEKLTQRKSSAAGNAKRYGHAFDPTPIEYAIEVSRALLAGLNPQSRILAKRAGKAATGTPGGRSTGSPTNVPLGSQGTGTGTGTGKGIENSLRSSSADDGGLTPNELRAKLVEAASGHVAQTIGTEVVKPIIDLMAQGCDLERHILPAIRERVPKLSRPLGNWGASFLVNEILALRTQDEHRADNGAATVARVDFGGGVSAPHATIRNVVARGEWLDIWGPKPGSPDCRISDELMAEIMATADA